MSRSVRREVTVKNRVVRFRRDPFLGSSENIVRLKAMAQSMLGSSLPILIQGETGTGKGVLAEWLVREGPRSKAALVEVNCAGSNGEQLESELFGHEEPAFTGAMTGKAGLLEAAHRGSLFLDDLGDMDLRIQPKLLQVLDTGRFRRTGGARERDVDIHFIAAAGEELAARVAEGKFRRDLFFRVNTLSLVIPPLRVRSGDIAVIAQCFLEEIERKLSRGRLGFGKGVMHAMKSYSWPGNIRELRNVLERAALLCKDGVIQVEDLHFQYPASMPKAAQFVPCGGSDKDMTLKELERQYISFMLQKEKGKAGLAAAKLGIPKTTFYSKLKQYNISTHPEKDCDAMPDELAG